MKDIQEIILEMDNLSNQIATTLNEEDIIKEEEAIRETAEILVGRTPTFTKHFCCVVSVPPNFPALTSQRRITYDLSCLEAKVEPSCSSGNVTFKVKVVGCIPFIINVGVDTTNKCTFVVGDINDALCCGCCVCVDQDICTTNSDWVAFTKAASLNFNCNNVRVDSLTISNVGECGVQVTGDFKFFLDNNCCNF